MAKKNEVVKAGTTAVAAIDFGEFSDQGFENVSGDDLVLPFLGVLQSNSPQVENEVGDGGIEGAKQGSLFNTVTEEIFDGKSGVTFIPACTEHLYVEWIRRNAGGGFVGVHPLDSEFILAKKKLSEENHMKFGKVYTEFDDKHEPTGNQLTETFYVYGLLVVDGQEPTPAAVAFTSTKISPYKKWMTKVNMFTVPTPDGRKQRPPLFAHQLRLTTVQQKNTDGTYANIHVAPLINGSIRESLLDPKSELFQGAHSVLEMVKSGLARISYETQESGSGGDAAPAPMTPDGDPVF